MNTSESQTERKSALQSSRAEQWLLVVSVIVLFGLLYLLLLGFNMRRGLNHDEHQFVASAVLLYRDALLPYADFAYFHVPGLSLLYAIVYQLDDNLLLGARLFSIYCAWMTLGLVFFAAYRRSRANRLRLRLLFATLATGWMAALPLFIYTSGRAWNHDLPIFLLLLAFFIHSDVLVERRSPAWLGASGLMMGLASTARLSFALLAVPFLLVLWLYPVFRGRDRWFGVANFTVAGLLGGLPAIALFAVDPQAFLFGNLEYIRLNTEFYQQSGATVAMTLPGKIIYLAQLFLSQPGSLIAFIVLLVGSWPLWGTLRNRLASAHSPETAHGKSESLFRYAFILLLLAFSLFGAFAATPSQPQYFYVLFPLIVLGSVYAFTAWPERSQRSGLLFFSGAALVTILLAIPSYLPGLAVVFTPQEWYPVKVHERGGQVARLVHHGAVLTLAPIHALEGHAGIYPEFATGPFGWRVAPLVEPERRQRFHLVAEEDLTVFLDAAPPQGILVGLEQDDSDDEAPFVDYATTHNYVPVDLPDEGTLWLASLATLWDGVQLGGVTLPEKAVQPGNDVVLTFYLQNRQDQAANLNVLVRLVDVNGTELMRDEGWPWGSPTSEWPIDAVWPDGHTLTVPEDAAPGYYAVEISLYDPENLEAGSQPFVAGHLLVANGEAAANVSPLARFEDGIELVLGEVAEPRLDAGDTFSIQTLWRATQPVSANQTIFVHLINGAGELAAQVDSPPQNGFLPTSHWLPDAPVEDEINLILPSDLPPGPYQLRMGMYDANTLQRLPVLSGPTVGDELLLIATIQVQ